MTEMFYLLKRDLYECPMHMGYTGIRDRAGIWPREYVERRCDIPFAEKYTRTHEHYALPVDAAPEFTNACFDDMALAHVKQQRDQLLQALKHCLMEHGGFTIKGETERMALAAIANAEGRA